MPSEKLQQGDVIMTEKEKAAICLNCTEIECTGEAKCFLKKQKEYQKKCNKKHIKCESKLSKTALEDTERAVSK